MLFIRPEQRSPEWLARHGAELARWVYEASNPFADWYFGDPAIAREVIDEWTQRAESEVSLERALIMIDRDDRPLGCLIGMGGPELDRCRLADFMAFCDDLGTGKDAESVLDAVVPAARNLFPPVEEDEFYISRVATSPAMRGKGFGRALVAGAIEFAYETGFHRFRLDVSRDNARAIKTYEALGFGVTATSRHEESGLEYVAMTFAR